MLLLMLLKHKQTVEKTLTVNVGGRLMCDAGVQHLSET
jgi:hypothetical protein